MNIPKPNPAAKATILFVDDEERILRSLKMMFRGQYEVLIATDGRAAIEMVRERKVHVVVSDQRMPEMLGVDLLRTVREISPNTMRILLTGYSDLAAVIDSINEGEIFRYINKPWDPEDIRTTLAKAAEIAFTLDAAADSLNRIVTQAPIDQYRESLLVVDDDPAVPAMVRELMAREMGGQHPVEWARDLNEAFAILAEKEVAVMLTELSVAGLNMTGVIKSLKRHHPRVLTMVLTSFKDSTTLIELINQGQVHRFLPKPVNRALLLRGLKSALERYRAYESAPVLLRRHAVEISNREEDVRIGGRILGFVKRIRERALGLQS